MKVYGKYSEFLQEDTEKDICSKLRHWLANRGLITHNILKIKGLRTLWKEYKDALLADE